ncbi:MAG: FAD-dependent oxidoreductase, partial [Planctomycetaceae bacterium]
MLFRQMLLWMLLSAVHGSAQARTAIHADLLVVGGTESGCAAAVQAARMGVRRIVLVNDIDWLGGQFSAEGLGAIDENRAHGYDGSVPI